MMEAVLLGLLLHVVSATAHEISVSCMMAYDEGGALGIFQSPECPQWALSANVLQNQTRNCQFATLQGHREYQEDRVICNLYLKIPILGKDLKEAFVTVLAVFDGHGGKEASEMASKDLLDYFQLHIVFSTYKQLLHSKNKHDLASQGKNDAENNTCGSSQGVLPVTGDKPIHGILKEALLGAIHDIDMKFSLEALDNKYASGSTATVTLLHDGKFLVASVGDSKALLCSHEGSSMSKLYAEELTRDHHPGRDDERARIEAAGGFVRVWGVPRVNGILAVSRSIGDIYLKRYGVVAIPEVIDWQPLKSEDRYMVVATDGIFESLTTQDVCDLLHTNSDIQETEVSNNSSVRPSSSSLAGLIVNTALRKGSMDNLSAIVVQLGVADVSSEL